MAKSSTIWLNVKGTVRWAKVYEPDEFDGARRFIINFYPDNGEEWEKLNKSGIMVEPKEDQEGNKYVRFRRDMKKTFDDEVVFFTPPEIKGAVNVHYEIDGKKVFQYKKADADKLTTVGEQTLIGNDSRVIATVTLYNTSRGKGHRLMSLNVLDLVEYVPQEKVEETVETTEEKAEEKAPW